MKPLTARLIEGPVLFDAQSIEYFVAFELLVGSLEPCAVQASNEIVCMLVGF